MKFGHLLDTGEITPSIFSKLDNRSRLKLFITLFNSCVDEKLRLPFEYSRFDTIEVAFKARIDELLRFKYTKAKLKSFCFVSNFIILAYKNNEFEKIAKIIKEPKYPVAKLIKMVYKTGKFELCFDANFMFSQFVYDKIAQKNFDKDVSFQNEAICISQNGVKKLCVIPCFKNFSVDNVENLQNEMDSAVRAVKEQGFEKVYVVMPRNKEFKKHIEVRHCECGQNQIKLVPYTIINKISLKG